MSGLQWVSRGATGEDLQARGIAYLVGFQSSRTATEAVETLKAAAARDPGNARILSDLAAAYFVQAHEDDEPGDLIRALDIAAKALHAAPDLPEARFNLALILGRLHLCRLATSAWQEYREIEHDSEWKDEAREHLEHLRQPSALERWTQALVELEQAALRGDMATTRRLVWIDPQSAREHAIEERLGGWGDRHLTDSAGAEIDLRVAAVIGKALIAVNGDSTVKAAVEAVEKAGPGSLRHLASGHRAFREAMKAYRPLRTGEASVHFAAAREALKRGGSPIELWALCGLARCWGYEGRYSDAERAYGEILLQATPHGFSSLAGWTQWGLGWVAARQGRPAETLSRMRAAEVAYRTAREAENLGAARFLVGGSLFLLGQREAGWRHLQRALEALEPLPTVFRRHVLLTEAAIAAHEEGLLDASLLLQDEALRIAEESRDPIRLTEALRARSRILDSLGRTRQALTDLDSAKRIAITAPHDSTGRKLRADLLWGEGEVLGRRRPGQALKILTSAIDEYRALNARLSEAYALLARARAALSLELDNPAFADLETALRIFEDPATGIREEDLRISYSESIQDVYDEWIRFQWDQNQDSRSALAALERARAFSALSQSGNLSQDFDWLADDRVVVEYALLEDRLLTWVIERKRLSAFERSLKSSELEALVDVFVHAIQQRRSEEEVLKVSSRLYDILIPEHVRALPPHRTVYFIPDKVLNKVPFAALYHREAGRFFIEDHPVAIAPSLTQILLAGRRSPMSQQSADTPSALLIGNPAFDRNLFRSLRPLSGAEDEIALARTAFQKSRVLVGEDVTKSRLLSEMDQFDIFVFAGHTVINARLPSRSYLVLAPSSESPDPGLLLAAEIRTRRFRRLNLVVLSACSSVGPRGARISGIAGMAQPFLEAGVQTVVGTLWDVEDRKTAKLLTQFYTAVAGGRTPAHALRSTQLAALQRDPGLKDLRTWSALEVVDLNVASETHPVEERKLPWDSN
ncbi:MAG TPA: CHAT domain-containing protein [Thermoanaerobaculia bacterium]